MRGCRVGSKYLSRAIQAAELPVATSALSLANAVVAQRANVKAYQAAKKDHIASRELWLFTLARSKSQDDGKPAEDQHRNSLVSIERQRRQAKNVKMMNWKIKSLGTPK
jgi:hemerythrin-like domain-containing protein